MFKIQSSDECKVGVYEDLREGSQPGSRFYFLVAVSTLIASFGLVMNRTAVIIGAMLVAPLMTPILGLGLGLGLARVEATFIRMASGGLRGPTGTGQRGQMKPLRFLPIAGVSCRDTRKVGG